MEQEQKSILEAIREEPDADVHRLAYADWLEDYGNGATDTARAGLIRLQIAKKDTPRGEWTEAERAEERRLLRGLLLPTFEGWHDREGAFGFRSERPGDTPDERLDEIAGYFDRGFLKPEIAGECHRLNTFLRAAGEELKQEPLLCSLASMVPPSTITSAMIC